MKNNPVMNLIGFIKFMIKLLEDNILAKKKEISSMAKVDTSFRREDHIMTDSGGITKWKEKAKPTLEKDSLSTRDSGRLINIMAGVYCIPILIPTSNGFHMKVSSKTE